MDPGMNPDASATLPVLFPTLRLKWLPLWTNNLHWSHDGKVAVVLGECIVIIPCFLSRHGVYEAFVAASQIPMSTRQVIPLPVKEVVDAERVPLPISCIINTKDQRSGEDDALDKEHFMASLRSNQIIYDVMSKENIDRRGQFCFASWGPVGTGQAGSCAIATISTTARVVIYVAPKFVLSYAWEELVNLSEKLLLHLEEIQMIQWNSQETSTSPPKVSNKRRAAVSTPPATLASHRSSLVTSEQYSTFCDLLNVQTAAWSPKLKDGQKSGFLALGGSLLVTLWKYNFQSHGCHFEERPCSLLKTEEYGKIVSSAWTNLSVHDTNHPLRVVYGSCQGWILICKVSPAGEARIDRSWRSDGAYDVLSIVPMHLQDAIVFSAGSTLGVWNLTTEKSTTDAHTWQAHDHNISGLVISCMDEVFSCALDGSLKQWDVKGKDPRCLATFDDSLETNAPLYGLAISPYASQLTYTLVSPPKKTTREAQTDNSNKNQFLHTVFCRSPTFSQNRAGLIQVIVEDIERGKMPALWDLLCILYVDNRVSSEASTTANTSVIQSNLEDDANEDSDTMLDEICNALREKYDSSPSLSNRIGFLQTAHFFCSNMPLPLRLDFDLINVSTMTDYWMLHDLRKRSKRPDEAEKKSLLIMCDYMSLQTPLLKEVAEILQSVYSVWGKEQNIDEQKRFTDQKDDEPSSSNVSFLQPRETCPICAAECSIVADKCPLKRCQEDQGRDTIRCFRMCQSAAFYTPVCSNGHDLHRCFRSFQIIHSFDVAQCTGCGKYTTLNVSKQEVASDIKCRLCGHPCL